MTHVINNVLIGLNNIGRVFCDYAAGVFVQSALLVILLLVVDLLLRKRVRAVFRYFVWLLVLVKLVLPPTLSLPTGIGYWFGDHLPAASYISDRAFDVAGLEHTGPYASQGSGLSGEMPQVRPAEDITENDALITPANSAPTPLTWQAVLFVIWLVGVFAFLVVLIQRVKFVRGLIAVSNPAKKELLGLLEQCRRQIGVRRDIRLRISETIPSPAVCGFFSPTVLIPTFLVEKLSTEGLRATLIHELAHIKRGDLWVNSVQTFLQIIYFYNPFVWFANAVIRRVCEEAVDETVIVTLGGQAKNYSNTLIDIGEMAFWRADLGLRLVGVAESKKALKWRIKHMLNRPIPKSAKLGVIGVFAVVIAGAILLPMAAAAKDDKEQRARFIATLPDGVTIELVGICEHPSQGKQWWRPDGTTIETDGFRDYDYDDAVVPEENECAKLLAFKLDDSIIQNAGISWSLKDGSESRFAPDYIDKEKTRRRPIQVILAALPEAIRSTSLQLGVATGPWKGVAAGAPSGGGAHTLDSITQGDVIYHEAREENGYIHISATHLLGRDYDCRIVAKGQDGKLYEPLKYSNPGREMRQCKSVFDIPLEQVKWFHLQARPFQWVTFNNVSLKPGVKTDVKTEVKIESAESKVPAEMLGTWFFDNSSGDDEQMAIFPDGHVVVLYSNGNKHQTNYINGFIKLVEYGPLSARVVRCSVTVQEDGTLVSRSVGQGRWTGKSKRWKRIAPEPHTNLLRPLTGPDNSKADVQVKVKPDKTSGKLAANRAFFTPPIARIINSAVERKDCFIDFDNDKLYSHPFDFHSREGGMGLLQILEIQRKRSPHYIKIRYKMVPRTVEADAKITSNKKLQDLGKAMVMFARDHQRKLPDSLQDFAPYLRNKQDIEWLSTKVKYLGKGKSDNNRPDTVIAYDSSLLMSQQGTNVLFLDAHVEFVKGRRLDELGIKPKP